MNSHLAISSLSSDWAEYNNLPIAMLLIHPENGRIMYANSAAEEMLDAPNTKLCQYAIGTLGEDFAQIFTQLSTEQKPLHGHHIRCVSATGHTRRATVTASLMDTTQGKYICFLLDTTREGLSGLYRQEAAQAASTLAAMLAHEIKNPLAGIRGAAQLLGKQLQEDHAALTRVVIDETDRIQALLAQVDLFADAGQIPAEAVNIHEVLRYVREISEGSGMKARITEAFDPSLPPISGHRALLIQLFLNLVKNADEALAHTDQPQITLRSAYFPIKKKTATDARAVPMASIIVEDNGPGIPESAVRNLFEPRLSAEKPGRGLGLTIVAHIAASLGGTAELAETRPGHTAIRVLLPLT